MHINKRLLSKITLVFGALLITIYLNSKNQLNVQALQSKINPVESIQEQSKDVEQKVEIIEPVDENKVKEIINNQVAEQIVELDAEIKTEEASQPGKEPMVQEITKGLSYIITKEGDASVVATSGKKVSVHYTGYLQNADGSKGKKFDSSKDRGELFQFPLGAGYVIRGWDMGVEGMQLGEERTLIIAPEFGYGHRGVPGAIPGGATLIFDVEFHGQR